MSDQTATKVHCPIVLLARGISKTFPGVRALDQVDLVVRCGKLNALIGENGAGKSTLMNILAGILAPDEGDILLNGQRVKFRNPREAQDAGVSIIHQELNLVPNLTVAENIFLGREPRTRLGLIDYRKMFADARRLLAMLDLSIDPRMPLERLRVGTQQIVEIVKALSIDAKVIIMDEPTSAISEKETVALFRLIHRLKARGVGMIYITHKLAELSSIADDVTVLRDGKLISAKPFHEVTHDELVRMMVGRDPLQMVPRTRAPNGEKVLQVRSVSLQHPQRPREFILRDVSFDVRAGEIVGLFGLMGAGRTELLQTIFGLHPHASSGSVAVAGKQVNLRSPREAIAARLAMAPEDRKLEGLILFMSVVENCSLACLQRITRFGFLQTARERRLVEKIIDRLGVKTPSIHEKVRNLSGGNQQKVVLSKWLATEPKVLLLDEPTRGIDLGAKREIYSLISELAQSGLAIVLVSSEMPEILALADRILVVAEGRIAAEFNRQEATEETMLLAALPKETERLQAEPV